MKEILKKKKLLIGIASVILILIILIIGIALKGNKKEEKPIHQEEIHSMYVKINPFVKLQFKEEYYLCNYDNQEAICDEHTSKVVGYELINDDAKTFYKDLDFKDKDLYQVLLMLCEVASDHEVAFEKLEITTDSKYIDNDEILNYLKENSKYEINYSVSINFQERMNEDEIVKEEHIQNEKYLVTFDSDGGNKIESELIDKGNKATKPNNPVKEGYQFIEWQLDGKAFDFNTTITEDITLKAKWKKEKTDDSTTNPSQTNTSKKTIKTSLISQKNLGSGYRVNLTSNIQITVTIEGNKNLVDKIMEKDLNLYIDLKGLKAGTHTVEVKTENIHDGLSYSFNPSKVSVKITSENGSSETSKPETSGTINLNDNVMYTETGFASEDFMSWKIKDACLNKTIAELKKFDPNYNKSYLEDLISYTDNTLITKKIFLSDSALTLLTIFPNCKDTIPSSYRNIFDNVMGWTFLSIENNTLKVRYISLDERYKYSSYHQNLDLSQYNLTVPDPYSGGGTPPTPQILTEKVCEEYHLKCDRW